MSAGLSFPWIYLNVMTPAAIASLTRWNDKNTCLLCHVAYGAHELFIFQAEDGIRDLVRSRGLGDVYKGQSQICVL